jgi:hypothetical protein
VKKWGIMNGLVFPGKYLQGSPMIFMIFMGKWMVSGENFP